MLSKHCRECGTVHEVAAQKLNQLKKKIDRKLYIHKYWDVEERINSERFEPLFSEMWEWRESINTVLGEIS